MEKRIVWTDRAPQPIGPYHQAVAFGDFIFTSGQIGIDPSTGKLIGGAIEQETEQALHNLKSVLEAAGASLSAVVKCTVYVTDMGDYPRINEVYGRFFKDGAPARSLVEVRALPGGARVEIDAIAYRRSENL